MDVYSRGRAEPTTHIDRYGSVDLFAARGGGGGAGGAQSAAAVDAAAAAAKRDAFAGITASEMSAMSDAQRGVTRLLEGSIGGSSSDSSERGFSPASMASEFDEDDEDNTDNSAAHDDALFSLFAARAASARDTRDNAVFSSFDDARALLRRQIARVPARWDDGSSSSTS